VEKWGYIDARLAEAAPMTAEDVRSWTQAIDPDLLDQSASPGPAASPDPAAPGETRGGHGGGTAGGAG
jgi:hypothetical protein